MKLDYRSRRVTLALKAAPPTVRKAFYKQIAFLANNIQHPSLHAKKYDEANDIWQARITSPETGDSTSSSKMTPISSSM
jgi:hypothetical protein